MNWIDPLPNYLLLYKQLCLKVATLDFVNNKKKKENMKKNLGILKNLNSTYTCVVITFGRTSYNKN